MGTTSKMSIPYPENNDFVADGATNMKDIADQVDAKTGLILITSGVINNTTEAKVQSCFVDNFRNYMVAITCSAGTNNTEIKLQLMLGTNQATTNYRWTGVGASQDGTASNNGSAAGGSYTDAFPVTFVPDTNRHNGAECFIFQPKYALFTTYSCDWIYEDSATFIGRKILGRHKTATAYDGIRIFNASAFTGTYAVYGMNA